MKVPMYIKIDGQTYRVAQISGDQKKYKDGYAYLLSKYNDYVYPYRGEIDNLFDVTEVGVYRYRNVIHIIRPHNDEDKRKYSISRIIELTPDMVFKNLDDLEIDPAIEDEMTTDGEIFKPQIKVTDDLMLAGMKYAIGKKNINFNNYSSKFPDVATRSNSRRAITNGSSLKCDMADRFSNIFDINFSLMFYDKAGCRNPMDPEYKTIYYINNDDSDIDFTDPSLRFEEIKRS